MQYMASVGLPTFRTKGHDDNDDPANKPPVAANDSAATTAGKPITLNVLANDTDPDGNVPLTVTGSASQTPARYRQHRRHHGDLHPTRHGRHTVHCQLQLYGA